MRAIRATAALLLIAACAAAAARILIPKLRCNIAKAQVNQTSRRSNESLDVYERGIIARRNVETCRRCLESLPNDYEFQMLLAVNEHRLGENERAEESYRKAIALNERPEMFAYLAVAQLERGKSDEARENLYRAAVFSISFVDLVSEPLRSDIYAAVAKRHEELKKKKN